jgi:hypothetical protein
MAKKTRRRVAGKRQAPSIVQKAEREIKIAKWDLDPVKQYVRQYGWLNIIKRFDKKRRQRGDTTPFKYLTLPGENSSDIGLLIKSRLLGNNTSGIF